MKRLLNIIFFFSLLLSSSVFGQSIIQPDRAVVKENFRPPLDTLIAPVFLGELRTRTADSSIYISISLTAPKKWIKASGSGGADGNNYPTALSFNQSNDTLTLSLFGRPSLSTAIPRAVYDGSETKIGAGTGGVIVTGLGTTPSPYLISVPSYNGSETKLSAGPRISISGSGTIPQPYLITAADTDSSRYSTIARVMQKIDSLAALASIRSIVSGDSSILVTSGTGPTVDLRSRDSAIDIVYISSDGSVLFEHWGSGDGVDTIDVRALAGGPGGDNWGSQAVVKDGTLVGDGTTISPLGVNLAAISGLATYYTADGKFTGNRSVDLDGLYTQYLDTVAGVSSIFRISHAGILVQKSNAPPIASVQDSSFIFQSGGTYLSSTTRKLNLVAPDSIYASSRITHQGYLPILSPFQLTTKAYVDSLLSTINGSETKISAGANVTVTGAGTTGSPYIISATAGGGPAGVTSVNLTMPSAFTVLGGPITSAGTFSVTANGTASDYIAGNGAILPFPAIPTYDGSETKISAGPGIGVTGSGTTGSPYVITNLSSGSVVSVGMSVPAGLSVSPATITTSGTFAITTSLNGLVIGTGSGFSTASVSAPLTYSGGNLSITQSSASTNGWITSTNFQNWESKQQPLQFRDESNPVGALGVVRNVNFVGARIAASLTDANTVTVTVSDPTPDGNNYPLSVSTSGGLITIARSGLSDIVDSLTTTRVLEGSRLYFTTDRARQSVSASTGLSYNASTGVFTNTSPDQVVSISGTSGISVTGSYPNFTISGSGITGIFSQKSSITPEGSFNIAYVKSLGGTYEISDKVLKLGNVNVDPHRTITVNAMLYADASSVFPGLWYHVATLPSGYRPTGIVNFSLANYVPTIGNPATTPIRANDNSTGITGTAGAEYNSASGYIDPDTGYIYVKLGTIVSTPTRSGVSTVLIPIVVTFFNNNN
jgi:hypothetical protein